MRVKTLVEKEGFPNGTIGLVVSIYPTGVACYRKNCKMPKYAHIDVSSSIENMLLKIDALGLGGVWLGIAPISNRMKAVKKVLEIPEKHEAFAIIACGYPAEERVQQDRYDEKRIHYID